jgi:hypothetical protein
MSLEVDYVDWSKIGPAYDWVATDESGKTYGYKGAEPLLTEDKEDGGYWRVGDGGEFWYPEDIINSSAIVAPLPSWRESKRKRP